MVNPPIAALRLVDPAADGEADPRPRAEPLAEVRAIGDATARIDPRVLDGDDAAIAGAVDELRALLVRGVALLGELRRLDDAAREAEPVDDERDDFDEAPAAVVLSPPRLANVCFAGAFELNRVLRELDVARTSVERLVACETTRRKLLRACRAVLDAAGDHGDTEPPWRLEIVDLAAAIAVRRLYARFRAGLRRPDGDDASAVLTAARYAAGALAALVADHAYDEVRASDRALLRRLHQRALEWARHDRGATSGVQLLEDVWTSADLLRDINRRQELRTHDAALVRRALAQPSIDPRARVVELDALLGLDDELDALLGRCKSAPDTDGLADAITACLVRLR